MENITWAPRIAPRVLIIQDDIINNDNIVNTIRDEIPINVNNIDMDILPGHVDFEYLHFGIVFHRVPIIDNNKIIHFNYNSEKYKNIKQINNQ